MQALHGFFFAVLPYIAIAGFIGGMYYKIKVAPSKDVSEEEESFWGYVPLQVGLFIVLLGHLVAFMFPKSILAFNSHPVRLVILEVTAVVFGMSILVGLTHYSILGFLPSQKKVKKSLIDIAFEVLLLYQVVLGCWTAIGYRWGTSWFAANLSPYLWSIIKFNPQTAAVKAMPHVVQFHIITAFLILLLIPFSRLARVLSAPYHRMIRPH